MTAPELFFLLLGLSLGVAVGAALLDVLRAHPPRPEVRVTVTHNALPPRIPVGQGLAGDGGAARALAPPAGTVAPAARSPSPVEADVPVLRPTHGAALLGPMGAATMGFELGRRTREPVAVPIAKGHDPALAAALEMGPSRTATPHPATPALATSTAAVAVLERPEPLRATAPGAPGAPGADPGAAGAGSNRPAGDELPAGELPAGDCAAERQLSEERCLIAMRARERAEEAAQELRTAQRAYDEAASRAESSQRESDPRAVAELKEAARRAFRNATEHARERRDLEAAATAWLTEINRINKARHEAAERAVVERQRADELLVAIEGLTVAADAARITAETATNACYAAREALAACEEAHLGILAVNAVAMAPEPSLADEPRPEDAVIAAGLREAGRQPAIYRLLQGDRETLARIVAAVATTPEEQRRLQLLLSELVDAVVAGAIEKAYLDFPPGHVFWGDFSRAQCRDVAVALASLGYRFDGLGGFGGARVPSARDLSLAVGYAGLDPRRIRRWPSEEQAAELYRDVAVAADEYLAANAADLSLAEMVTLLGRRSEGLADLWNQWGRVRPLLLTAPG